LQKSYAILTHFLSNEQIDDLLLARIFCWILPAKRSDQGLFENETPRSGLQYFNNSAFDSVITELKSKPTRSLLERASAAMM
jgi:hypothetical protein